MVALIPRPQVLTRRVDTGLSRKRVSRLHVGTEFSVAAAFAGAVRLSCPEPSGPSHGLCKSVPPPCLLRWSETRREEGEEPSMISKELGQRSSVVRSRPKVPP